LADAISNDDVAALRQGDLCVIPPIPVWNLKESLETSDRLGTVASRQLPVLRKRTIPHEDGQIVVVCTHCCDIENPRGRQGVHVAPVFTPPVGERDADRLAPIRRCGTIGDDGNYGFLTLFPLEEARSEKYEFGVADFSLMMPIAPPKDAIEMLLDGKLSQMEDELRLQFRTKLAIYFSHPD